MAWPWQMIPRYHPQIRSSEIWKDQAAERVDLPVDPTRRERQDIFAVNKGSTALRVAVESLGLPENAGVAVPPYCCWTVYEAVAAAGKCCVFVDIDPGTFEYDADALKGRRDEFQAAIMVHLFGYIGTFEAIRQAVEDRPIIEDCAHSPGSLMDGRTAGSFGDAAAFSFSLHKPVSVGGGGLLAVNNPSMVQAVRRRVDSLGPAGCQSRIRLSAKAELFRRPWYGLLMAAGILRVRRDARWKPLPVKRIDQSHYNAIAKALGQLPERVERQAGALGGAIGSGDRETPARAQTAGRR